MSKNNSLIHIPAVCRPYTSELLQDDDHFKLEPLVTLEGMFNSRLHLGHKVRTGAGKLSEFRI